MSKFSLELLYEKIDKHSDLAQAYLDIDGLSFIMRMCRLKPYKYFSKGAGNKLELCRWWIDEFGNSFEIKYKTICITYNDLKISQSKIISTDLYHGFSLNKISKVSKLAHIYCAKDEGENIFIISFLGADNYLRSYQCLGEEWEAISPLTLGLEQLQLIEKNKNLEYSKHFTTEEVSSIYQLSGEIWMTYLPMNKILINELKKNYDDSFSFLEGDIS